MARNVLLVSASEINQWEKTEQWLDQLNSLIIASGKVKTAQNMQAACLIEKAWDGSWCIAICPRSHTDAEGFDSNSLDYGNLVAPGSGEHHMDDSVVLVAEKDRSDLAAFFTGAGINVEEIFAIVAA